MPAVLIDINKLIEITSTRVPIVTPDPLRIIYCSIDTGLKRDGVDWINFHAPSAPIAPWRRMMKAISMIKINIGHDYITDYDSG